MNDSERFTDMTTGKRDHQFDYKTQQGADNAAAKIRAVAPGLKVDVKPY